MRHETGTHQPLEFSIIKQFLQTDVVVSCFCDPQFQLMETQVLKCGI